MTNRRKKRFIEISIFTLLIGVVMTTTLFVIRNIQLREDLAFLQIDITDTIIEAKKCLENNGEIQDVYQAIIKGTQPEDVYICNKQNISSKTYPNLQKLSRRHIMYQYLPSDKCLNKKCNPGEYKINIGRGWEFVMSCGIQEGKCFLP